MSPDPVPAGRRRVRVDLVVHAGTEPIRYPVVAFGLHGPDGEHVTPRHSFLGDAELAPGMAATGSLEFDVPDRWAAPVLMLDGAAAGVTLEGLGPAPADPHTHH